MGRTAARWWPVSVAMAAVVGLAGCQQGPEGADEAEGRSCPPGSDCYDPVEPIGPGSAMTVEMFEFDYTLVEGVAVDGPVEITAVNVGSTLHNFRIDEAVGDTVKVEAEAGEEATDTLELFAGQYTFYCDVPGHREAGMEGTITVFPEGQEPDDPATAFETVGG